MKVNKISYERLINLGNYENEKVSLEVQLQDGETSKEALIAMKSFVDKFVITTKSPQKDFTQLEDLNNENQDEES